MNTNKLLDEGWDGVKTGITPHAGMESNAIKIRSMFICVCDSQPSRHEGIMSVCSGCIEQQVDGPPLGRMSRDPWMGNTKLRLRKVTLN